MLRIYALIFVIAILGGIGYGAKYYYDTTQATIATLRENNVKLESAVETAEQSVATLQQDMIKIGQLNKNLDSIFTKSRSLW
jgi:cell division protein FtsB